MTTLKQLAAEPQDEHSGNTADWHQLMGSTLKMDDLTSI
jgi:hypothetical protein